MLGKILESIGKQALEDKLILSELNRNWGPLLRALRTTINAALGDETVISLLTPVVSPNLGTDTSYREADNGAGIYTGGYYDPNDFPPQLSGRSRKTFVRYVGKMSAATSTSITFRLFNVTTNTGVFGSEFTTNSLAPDDSGLIEVDLGDDGSEYSVQVKRAGGGAEGQLLQAALVVRYV